MLRFLYIFFQFVVLLIIAAWAIQNSKPVSFILNDVTITTSTSVLIIFLLIIIFIVIIIQKFLFFLKQSKQKYVFYRQHVNDKKGYNSFVQGMSALVNKDFTKAIFEAKNVNKFLKDKSLSLLLTSETLKIQKKYDQLNDVYEEMLKNTHMSLLGLRGLMEQNLRSQDYHHAFVYGEKLFHLNPKIDKLYETLLNIIGKTNNWQKLIYLSDESLKHRIIDRNTNAENKAIAFFEMAKIKHKSFEDESISLMEKAIKLKENFPPFINFYIKLLINNNKLEKAKKILKKTWSHFPHPELKEHISVLAKALKISYFELVDYISANSRNHYQTNILLTESYIEEKLWGKARNQIRSLLEHRPLKEVCLLMSRIEEGDNGDPQKINSWISRSNMGKLSEIWICHFTEMPQAQWSAISKGGYFNSLEWKYPKKISELQDPGFDLNTINYIDE